MAEDPPDLRAAAPPEADPETGPAIESPGAPPLPSRYGGPARAEAPEPQGGIPVRRWQPRPNPGPDPLGRLLFHLLLPFPWLACAALAAADPSLAALASAAVAGIAWSAYMRLDARWTTLEWMVLSAVAAGRMPGIDVLWLLAAAGAGGLGAWLSRRRRREDDFFFLPTAVAGLLFAVMVLSGMAGPLGVLRGELRRTIDTDVTQMRAQLNKSAANDPETLEQFSDPVRVRHFLIQFTLVTLAGIWGVSMWLAGRLARSLAGRLGRPESSLKFFRIRQRYIFLLIAALVLEILNVLSPARGLAYLARPLLAWCAVAFFLEGLGVILFAEAVRQAMAGNPGQVRANPLRVLVLIICPPVGVMIGLVDVWADFRKLDVPPAKRGGQD